MPGRLKGLRGDAKFNAYRALHTTVIGPQGRPLEIQVRTREMHETAEFGVAAHWLYKRGKNQKDEEWVAWVKQLMDEGTADEADPREFMKTFRTDLFDEEVHVFTPKGQVKTLPAGSTPIDFAYAVHTDVGHRTVGLKTGGSPHAGTHFVRSSLEAGTRPSRTGSRSRRARARNKIRQWYSRETREEPSTAAEALERRSSRTRRTRSARVGHARSGSASSEGRGFYLALDPESWPGRSSTRSSSG
jgi:GTP pyrophosphokinase